MQTEQIHNFRKTIDAHIQCAKFHDHNPEKLLFAKSWLGKLLGDLKEPNPYLTGQGVTDVSEPVAVLADYKEHCRSELEAIGRLIEDIIGYTTEFFEGIHQYNGPIWNQIKELQKIGDKTLDDQEELAEKLIVLTYPYLQLCCQNLQEAKFQYSYKLNEYDTKHAG